MPKINKPAYGLHKPTGQAVVRLPLGKGRYRCVYLGVRNSSESLGKYDQVIGNWIGRQ